MELVRAYAALFEAPTSELRGVAESLDLPPVPSPAAHASCISFQRFPFGSIYLGPEGMMGGEALDRISGFWQVLGVEIPKEPDHISSLLGLLAQLLDQEQSEDGAGSDSLWARAIETLLHEHLLPWTTLYLESFETAAVPFYQDLAAGLRRLLEDLSRGRGGARVPLWLEQSPGLDDPRDGSEHEAFLSQLLAPSRTGFVLLRDDLARLGDELGLGVRAGERRYVLRAMAGQEPAGSLGWLSSFAEEWSDRLVQGQDGQGTLAQFWSDKARRSAALLRALASEPLGWSQTERLSP